MKSVLCAWQPAVGWLSLESMWGRSKNWGWTGARSQTTTFRKLKIIYSKFNRILRCFQKLSSTQKCWLAHKNVAWLKSHYPVRLFAFLSGCMCHWSLLAFRDPKTYTWQGYSYFSSDAKTHEMNDSVELHQRKVRRCPSIRRSVKCVRVYLKM